MQRNIRRKLSILLDEENEGNQTGPPNGQSQNTRPRSTTNGVNYTVQNGIRNVALRSHGNVDHISRKDFHPNSRSQTQQSHRQNVVFASTR